MTASRVATVDHVLYGLVIVALFGSSCLTAALADPAGSSEMQTSDAQLAKTLGLSKGIDLESARRQAVEAGDEFTKKNAVRDERLRKVTSSICVGCGAADRPTAKSRKQHPKAIAKALDPDLFAAE